MEPSPTLTALIAQYLLRCEVEGKSPRTVRAYRETLSRFLAAVALDDPAAVQPQQLYAYLGRYTQLTLETRHRYFREVRCFFNWLVTADYLERSPFRGMRNVRLPQRIVQPFSAQDIALLFAACPSASAMGLRDRAILLTLLDTGIPARSSCSSNSQTSTSRRAASASSTAKATRLASCPSPGVATRR
jgi:site-specific recombinase XerD